MKKIISKIFELDSDTKKLIPFMAAFSLSFVLIYLVFFDYTLKRFTDRAIGISILNGIDPDIRQNVYFMSLVIFAVTIIMQKIVYDILIHRIRKYFTKKEIDSYLHAGFELGLILIFTIIYNFANLFGTTQNELVQLSNYQFLTLPLVLSFEWIFFLVLHALFPKYIVPQYHSDLELWVYLFLPLVFLYSFAILRNDGSTLNFFSLSRIIFMIIFTSGLMLIKHKWLDLRRALYFSGYLFLIPIVHIIASEIQYSFKETRLMTPSMMVILFIGFSVLFFVSYIYSIYKNKPFNLTKRIENWILPIIIAMFFISAFHLDSVNVSFFDYVGYGNKVTPVQQLLQFGSIPLLDYWGAQHFEIGVFFYALLHGFNALEPVVWVPLKNLIILLIFYFSFKKIWGTRWTFLFILFLPAVGYINIYYFGAFLPMLMFHRLTTYKTKFNFFIFTMLSLLAFLWMPSMGKISIIASLVVMLVILRNKEDIKSFAIGAGSAYLFTVSSYVILLLFRGYNLWDQITLIKAFSAIDYNVGAYPTIIAGNTPAWATISVYGFFPLFYISYILMYFFKKHRTQYDTFMLFMVVASLISSLRLLGRHSLYEGEVNFDFMLLIFMTLILHYKSMEEHIRQMVFIILNLFFFLFYGFESTLLTSTALNNQVIKTYASNEVRYVPDANYPANLIAILKDALKENETFYENQNSNLLFELALKKEPFLHHSAQMIYSEPPQEVYIKQFTEKYANKEIPIVVFDSQWWWGADTDGIPTELSTFKLTEFIYEHYHPWIRVDDVNLWIANNSNLDSEFDISGYANTYPLTEISQTFNMKKLPYIWATYDAKFNEQLPYSFVELEVKLPLNGFSYEVPKDLIKGKGSYLYLTITSPSNYEEMVEINYLDNIVSFSVLPGTNTYSIRISAQYDWFTGSVNQIHFSSNDTIELEKLQILEGD